MPSSASQDRGSTAVPHAARTSSHDPSRVTRNVRSCRAACDFEVTPGRAVTLLTRWLQCEERFGVVVGRAALWGAQQHRCVCPAGYCDVLDGPDPAVHINWAPPGGRLGASGGAADVPPGCVRGPTGSGQGWSSDLGATTPRRCAGSDRSGIGMTAAAHSRSLLVTYAPRGPVLGLNWWPSRSGTSSIGTRA
jgi:hypothetical protein